MTQLQLPKPVAAIAGRLPAVAPWPAALHALPMVSEIARPWNEALDDALVEKLILAIQRTAVDVGGGAPLSDGQILVPAPELSAALTNLLASALEQSPACGTPADMRKVAEGAGKDLLQLMRGIRRIR